MRELGPLDGALGQTRIWSAERGHNATVTTAVNKRMGNDGSMVGVKTRHSLFENSEKTNFEMFWKYEFG